MIDVYVQKDSQILIWRVKKVMLKRFEKKYNVPTYKLAVFYIFQSTFIDLGGYSATYTIKITLFLSY